MVSNPLLAPKDYPEMPTLEGIRLKTAQSGIRYRGRDDLLLIECAEGTEIAGIFTQSLTAAAPVHLCRQHLADSQGKARAILINAGNANAFTGTQGEKTAQALCQTVAEKLGCLPVHIYPCSTGVIGEPLDADALGQAIKGLSDANWPDAANAICTTDAFPKYARREARLLDQTVTFHGIAKGAGMIAPDMATMLGFLCTDASLPHKVLQPLLQEAVAQSFNAITVDGDTSTNDTVLLAASQQVPCSPIITSSEDPALAEVRQALLGLCKELAQMIVRDGEGATKFVTVTVHEAENEAAAKRLAMSIANSPLVKTAFAGEDPNWGRIVAAVGKAGERAERDKLWINYGPHPLAADGQRHPDYDETTVADYMKRAELTLDVGVGVGEASFTVWTCDLGHPYVTLNADYRS